MFESLVGSKAAEVIAPLLQLLPWVKFWPHRFLSVQGSFVIDFSEATVLGVVCTDRFKEWSLMGDFYRWVAWISHNQLWMWWV